LVGQAKGEEEKGKVRGGERALYESLLTGHFSFGKNCGKRGRGKRKKKITNAVFRLTPELRGAQGKGKQAKDKRGLQGNLWGGRVSVQRNSSMASSGEEGMVKKSAEVWWGNETMLVERKGGGDQKDRIEGKRGKVTGWHGPISFRPL